MGLVFVGGISLSLTFNSPPVFDLLKVRRFVILHIDILSPLICILQLIIEVIIFVILVFEPFWHHTCILIFLDKLLKVLLRLVSNVLIINKVVKILVFDARLSLNVFELICTEQIVDVVISR